MKRTTLAFGLALAAVASAAVAHDAPLDVLGCHPNDTASNYHCHRNALSGQSFGSKAEAEWALDRIPPRTAAPSSGALPSTGQIAGKPRVVDAGTLEFGGRGVRLFGIDAPEPDQTCTAAGAEWRCGQDATFALAYETADHWVTCTERQRDRFDRSVAVCFVGPYDLAERMVRRGWALADRQATTDYVAVEDAARKAGEGLWRGGFDPPLEWRRDSSHR